MIEDVNGQLPFEGDTFIPVQIFELKELFEINTALETGSQYGATLEWLTKNFEYAAGCEPNKDFYELARKKGVCFNQNSVDFLTSAISKDERFFIFIDSHWNGLPCPLKDELQIISTFQQEPVIAIHDFKVPDKDFGYDIYEFALEFKEIEPYLNLIYPTGYSYHYNEETNGANRGIIFIYPKI